MTVPTTTAKPQDREHLQQLIKWTIIAQGPACDLNHIDVSNITDFSELFSDRFCAFHGDISRWNVSKGRTFAAMFQGSAFNGDISDWDVSNATHMFLMFKSSAFSGNISRWNVANVTAVDQMFSECPFDGDLSSWCLESLRRPSDAESMVSHALPGSRRHLKLPANISMPVTVLFSDAAGMHAWLAHQPIGRYHWDALLADPWSALATWATTDMREHANVYRSLNADLTTGSYVAHSHALSHLWDARASNGTVLALPDALDLASPF